MMNTAFFAGNTGRIQTGSLPVQSRMPISICPDIQDKYPQE